MAREFSQELSERESAEQISLHIQLWASLSLCKGEGEGEGAKAEALDFLQSQLAFIRTFVNRIDDSRINRFAQTIANDEMMPILFSVLFNFSNGDDVIAEEVGWILIGLFTTNADMVNQLCSDQLFQAFDFLLGSTNSNVLENVSLSVTLGGLQSPLQKSVCEAHSGQRPLLRKNSLADYQLRKVGSNEPSHKSQSFESGNQIYSYLPVYFPSRRNQRAQGVGRANAHDSGR